MAKLEPTKSFCPNFKKICQYQQIIAVATAMARIHARTGPIMIHFGPEGFLVVGPVEVFDVGCAIVGSEAEFD